MATDGVDFVRSVIFSGDCDLLKGWASDGVDIVTSVIFSEECDLLKVCLSHLHKLCVPLCASNAAILIRWHALILNKNFNKNV